MAIIKLQRISLLCAAATMDTNQKIQINSSLTYHCRLFGK
jgi:hypothetical protein